MTLAEAAARYRFQGPEDRKKAFRRAIDADRDQKIFNDQFVDGLSGQVDRLTATLERIDNIGYALLLYLAATVLSLHFPISAFGFSFSDSKNARELLLIVWFSLHFYRMLKIRDRTYCLELLECLLERRAGNNPITLNAMTMRYGIESNPFQLAQPDVQPGLFRRLLLIGFTFLAFGWIVIIPRVLVYAVLIATAVSILRDPSVAEWFSILVVSYAISVRLLSFGFSKLTGVGRITTKPAIDLT